MMILLKRAALLLFLLFLLGGGGENRNEGEKGTSFFTSFSLVSFAEALTCDQCNLVLTYPTFVPPFLSSPLSSPSPLLPPSPPSPPSLDLEWLLISIPGDRLTGS